MTKKIQLLLLPALIAVGCSQQRESMNTADESNADLQTRTATDQSKSTTPPCPEETIDPQQPSVAGVKMGSRMQEAETALNCAGYTVSYRRQNRIFQGGQTEWINEIVGSKIENGREDLIRAFIVDLDGPDDPTVFGVIREMQFRSNMPTFEEFNSRFHSAYARNGSVDEAYGGGAWYVEHNGQAIDETNPAFRNCKPLVQSSQEGCGFSQGYYLERFRGNPELVIQARVSIHDRDRDRAEFARLNQRIAEDQNAATEAARETGRANIPDL